MSHSHRRPRLSCFRPAAAPLEALEDRTLFSTAVMGFLQDWKIASGASAQPMFAETSTTNGAISSDELNWAVLTQVNYFSLRPNADGSLQTLGNGDIESASGEDVNIQLPPIVAEAHAKNANTKVFVTVGGGDGASITAMTALIDSNQTAWTNFANQMQSFVSTYGVSGVDLDWEPDSATKAEFDNFGTLIATLKSKGLTVSADVLSDPRQVTGTSQTAYVLNNVAIQNLDTINVMAYASSSESEADGYVAQWKTYLSGGTDIDGTTVNAAVSKLQYGIDDIDDTYNTAAVVKGKVDTTLSNGYGGLFLWDLDGDTNSTDIDAIGSEITAQGGTIGGGTGSTGTGGTGTTPTTGTISGTVTAPTASGAGVAGATIFVDSNHDGVLDDGEISAVTNASGAYTLYNVPAGTGLPLLQVLPSGYAAVSEPGDVTLAAGAVLTGENFVDYVPSTGTGTPTGGSSANPSPLTVAIARSTLPASVVSGTPTHGSVVVDVTNPTTSLVRGPVTIDLYVTDDSTGLSTSLATATRTLVLKPGKTEPIVIALRTTPASLAGNYTLMAQLTDANKDVAVSGAGPALSASGAAINFSETIIGSTLAAADVSGAKTRAVVQIRFINNGDITSSGKSTIALYVSPDGIAGDGTLVRSLEEPVVLKPGASRVLSIPLLSLPAVVDGNYDLVTVVTDPLKYSTNAAGSQQYALAAPFTSLTPLAVAIAPAAHGTAMLSFTVANSGNVAGASTAEVVVLPDEMEVGSAVVLLSEKLPAVAAGASRVFHVHLSAAAYSQLQTVANSELPHSESVQITNSAGVIESAPIML